MAVKSQRLPLPFLISLLAGLALAVPVVVPAPAQAVAAPIVAPAVLPTRVAKASTPSLSSAAATEASLQWAPFAGAQAYRVRYSRHANMAKSIYKRAAQNAIMLVGLKPGTKYYVRVQATKADAAGTAISAYSKKKSFKTVKKLTATAPSGLTARPSAGGAGVIALNWAFRAATTRYQVQYSTQPSFAASAGVTVSSPSAAVTGLSANTRYYFRVRQLNAAGAAASGFSAVVSASTQSPADRGAEPLRVASFNVRNGTMTSDTGSRSWAVRRSLVAKTITDQRPDVLGVQEAQYTAVLAADGTVKHQYQDLLDLLGGDYAITCATADNPNCDRSNNYSAGTRILYRPSAVSLLSSGVRELTIRSGDVRRFVAWAQFRQRSTGRQFFFADTHLDDAKTDDGYSQRIIQARQVLAEIAAQNTARLPVVLVGDMNSHKWRSPDNAPYKIYAAAGLVDPIGNPDFSRTAVNPTTEVRVHTEFDSWNNFGAAPDQHGWINGINVDYIWVAPAVKTLEYETVVNIDAAARFVGPPPSDHNMVRATVLIPAS